MNNLSRTKGEHINNFCWLKRYFYPTRAPGVSRRSASAAAPRCAVAYGAAARCSGGQGAARGLGCWLAAMLTSPAAAARFTNKRQCVFHS